MLNIKEVAPYMLSNKTIKNIFNKRVKPILKTKDNNKIIPKKDNMIKSFFNAKKGCDTLIWYYHILLNGLQSYHFLGSNSYEEEKKMKIDLVYKIREKKQLLNDAISLEKSGVFAIVLECVKSSVAKQITQQLKIPTIGIGSSVHCDGQVLVTDDLIGLNDTNIRFVKKFVNIKRYLNLGLRKFTSEVKSKKYPQKKHSY